MDATTLEGFDHRNEPADSVSTVGAHVDPHDTNRLLEGRSNVHDPSSTVPGVLTPLGDSPGNMRPSVIRPKQSSTAALPIYTAQSSCSSNGSVSESVAPSAPSVPPKVGTRFSTESARVLRQWLDTHKDHPFPNREDNEMLQRFTGLSKVQIKTWFANARRRRRLPDSSSSSVWRSPGDGTRTPMRPATPIPISHRGREARDMSPMERWVDSPPEDEPALARDIARAMASRNPTFLHRGEFDGSGDSSFDDASAPPANDDTSAGSRSSSMNRSGSSHSSAGFNTKAIRGRRRSRRGRPGRDAVKTSLFLPDGRFQCTFCTETFRTKYDWSRHEKSLHVPIERWLCSPRGPIEVNPSTGEPCCVYCGRTEPTSEHVATHNPDTCQQKTFNRKDHLKQHLRLVHDVEGVAWVIEAWKAPSLKIRSRCGFCDITLETWRDREHHLADHFKLGHTMANWSGDWGFEEHILTTVESFMPPYVIDYDRKSPFPFMASGRAPSSPRSAYELISLELAFFLHRHFDQRKDLPSNHDLRLQACRVIFASEALTGSLGCQGLGAMSWLRDLITFDDEVAKQARFGPLLSQAESRLAILRINGKSTLFESCPLEESLTDFFQRSWRERALVPEDSDLQAEAYRIIVMAEEQMETKTPDFVTNWFAKMVTTSTDWIGSFKHRNNVPMAELHTSQSLPSISQSAPMNMNWTPVQGHSDPTIGARLLMSNLGGVEPDLGAQNNYASLQIANVGAMASDFPMASNAGRNDVQDMACPTSDMQHSILDFGFYVLNDANYHRWFDVELKRWATATMSPENPAGHGHIPSDGEIQHQARLLLYEDGDPWNITAADNPEWLDRFKRDIGIVPVKTLHGRDQI
ncbi:Iroquois-class homeodomain protein irx-2 [Verticillium nonalfalfae]|uniref:Iroquois-class homeodomain protein irx-2 n=1 Tax=Verticillium nonalfalfae TaxID=1051616 RepID=A0A3M9YIW1_9PEZI|nr:Iroquois-class homeodomain protein irx-2 [Verticillium nonalfalfae]RNJ59892.1 Iroquois-class homeodomain protein irx-2 [Verticillium nonalfalfae]